jgi:hypothetical protein
MTKFTIKYAHKNINKKNILLFKSSHFFSISIFVKKNIDITITQSSDVPVLISKLIGKINIKKNGKVIEFIN